MAETNTLYSAVPDNGSLVQLLRSALGPIIMQALGHQPGAMSPYTAPAQSVVGSRYAAQVTAPEWERMQNEALTRLMSGVGGGLQQALGRLNSDEADKIGKAVSAAMDAGANSTIGRQLGAFALQTGAAQNIMGGNPIAAFQQAFVARNALYQTRVADSGLLGSTGFFNPFDDTTEMTNNATGIANEVMHAIRGRPDGTFGLAPNMAYTRGFKDQDLMSGLAMSAEAGVPIASGEQATRLVGEQARALEAIGDILGSREYGQLVAAANKLTMGKYTALDSGAIDKLRGGVRDLEALARVANVDGGRVLDMAASFGASSARAIGITDFDIQAGITGGAYTDFTGKTQAVADAIYASRANKTSLDFEQQRVAMLDSAVKNSQHGKEMAAIAYAASTGRYSVDKFNKLNEDIRGGMSITARQAAINTALAESFGSERAAREFINNEEAFKRARSVTKAGMAEDVNITARLGAQMDMSTAVTEAAENERKKLAAPVMGAAGSSFRRSGYFAEAVRQELAKDENSENFAAREALRAYEDAVAGRKSEAAAEAALRSRLGALTDTRAIGKEASRRESVLRAESALGMPGAEDLVGAKAGIAALRGLGGNAEAIAAAEKLIQEGKYGEALTHVRRATLDRYGDGPGTAVSVRREIEAAQAGFRKQEAETAGVLDIAKAAEKKGVSTHGYAARLDAYADALEDQDNKALNDDQRKAARDAAETQRKALIDLGVSEDALGAGSNTAERGEIAARMKAIAARTRENAQQGAADKGLGGLDSAGLWPGVATAAAVAEDLFDQENGLISKVAQRTQKDSDKLQTSRANTLQALTILTLGTDDEKRKKALVGLLGVDVAGGEAAAGDSMGAYKGIAGAADQGLTDDFTTKMQKYKDANEAAAKYVDADGAQAGISAYEAAIGIKDPKKRRKAMDKAAAMLPKGDARDAITKKYEAQAEAVDAGAKLQGDIEGTKEWKKFSAEQQVGTQEFKDEYNRLRKRNQEEWQHKVRADKIPKWLGRLLPSEDYSDDLANVSAEEAVANKEKWLGKERDAEEKNQKTSSPESKTNITGTLRILLPNGMSADGELIARGG